MAQKNMSVPKELKKFWESAIQLSEDGLHKKKLNTLLENLDIDCMTFHQLSKKKKLFLVKEFAIVEYLQINKIKIYKDKLTTVKNNFLITQLLKILDQLLIGKEKDLLPFWTKQSAEISEKLWLPTKTDYVDSDLNCYNTCLKNIMSNSWFSIKKQKVSNKNLQKTSYELLQSFPIGTTEKENTVTRSKKIKLYLNNDQKKEFKKWIGTSRYLYNKAITIINSKECLNKNKLRTKLVTKYENKWEIETPQGIREGAVFDAHNSYNNNMKKYKITKVPFTLKYRRKKNNSQTIVLPVDCLNKELKLYPKFLGKNSCLLIKNREKENIKWKDKFVEKNRKKREEEEKKLTEQGFEIPEKEIIKTKVGEVLDKVLRIQMTRTGRWYLCVPVDTDVVTSDNQGGIIALDPGVRTFLTGFSPDGELIKVGDNDINKIKNYLIKTDKFISEISKMKGNKKRRCNRAKLKRFEKVKNWIKDCHRKTTKYLLENYNYIILPPFNTPQMTKRKNRNINSNTVRNMLTWSHYKFRMMLLDKSNEYLNKYIICPTEEFTSKTCGCCGFIKRDLRGCKEYNCNRCGLIIDRDINGSRNILIKYLTELCI